MDWAGKFPFGVLVALLSPEAGGTMGMAGRGAMAARLKLLSR
jgi:hypothetical protein